MKTQTLFPGDLGKIDRLLTHVDQVKEGINH